MPSPAAIPEPLLALAPTHLANYRKERYQGDDLCVAIEQLTGRDRTLLRHLYEILNELLYSIADASTDDAQKWQAVVDWARRHNVDRIIDEVRELGLASQAERPGEELSKAMHDVRGGALSALLGRLQMLEHLPREGAQLKTIFVLTRDHLKIMRNAFTGLDEPRRQADRKPKAHAMSLMLEKWHDSVVGPKWRERPVRLDIDCRYEGPLTECCLESAAIDRIFYNLAGNASRYAADTRLEMVVFPIPRPPDSDCLRFVLSNEVSEADATVLRAMVEDGNADGADGDRSQSLFKLFEPEVSSTGSGYGLTVVADFVTGAFGLRDRTEALHGSYLGAILDGRTFRLWFHWPIASKLASQKLDDYHRPEDSLSDT